MRLCIIEIEYEKLKDMTTEVFFKIASARASGFSVARVDIKKKENDKLAPRKLNFLARILRGMKKRGAIQFFVMPEAFERSATEAQYLSNVFPEVVDAIPSGEDDKYIFVRI